MIYVHILTYDYKATRAARRISLWVYLSSVYIGKAHWISSVLLRRSPRLSKEVRPKPNLNYDVGRQPRRYRSDIKIPHENGRETKYRLSMGVLLMSAESTFVRSAETKRISSRPSLRRPFPPALPVPGTSTDTISAKRVLGRLATRFFLRTNPIQKTKSFDKKKSTRTIYVLFRTNVQTKFLFSRRVWRHRLSVPVARFAPFGLVTFFVVNFRKHSF